jgi:hypothetical protein
MCILEKFYRVIFCFFRFDWLICVTQLVAKDMKEIITCKISSLKEVLSRGGEMFSTARRQERIGGAVFLGRVRC